MDRRYVGPSFRQIADRYREWPDAANYLARKIQRRQRRRPYRDATPSPGQ